MDDFKRGSSLFPKLMFFLIVLLPLIVALTYALKSKSPIYQSTTIFAIEDRQRTSNFGLNGFISAINGGVGEPNSLYTLRKFINSADALSRLEKGYGFRKHYLKPMGNRLTRLDDNMSKDQILKYYRRMIKPRISTTENIVTLEVRAFSPEIAKRIAIDLVQISEKFVNEINMQAIEDQVAFQLSEVKKSQERVIAARSSLTNWRNKNGAFDPMSEVITLQGLISNLEIEISAVNSEIALIQASINPITFAPRKKKLVEKLSVLNNQLVLAKAKLAGPNADTLSIKMDEFYRLTSYTEFAEANLEISMSSLETAKQIALQQQKYILLISKPSLPSDILFPRPAFHTSILFFILIIIYGIIILLWNVLRDYKNL